MIGENGIGKPGVSIFIITYLDSEERCRVLEATCRNALEQRYPEFEVVVSDNAGKIPATEALAGIDDPRLKVFRNEENLGMAGNMNMCLERCKYNIFKLNCDDDLLHPQSLALSVPWVDDDTLVIHDREKFVIGTVPEGIGREVQPPPPVEERLPGYRTDFWEIGYDALPGDTLCTRKLFSDLGGYDPGSAVDDWDFAVRARLHKRIVHLKSVLCYQGVWDLSLTEKMLKEEPFYFQCAGLRTRYKVLRDSSLGWRDRMHIRRELSMGFLLNSLRFIKYASHPQYRSGYAGFVKEFFREMGLGNGGRLSK